MSKLWGGCFSQATNDYLTNLNKSIGIDQRLYHEDIQGSIAYAHGLNRAGLLTTSELNIIVNGLEKIRDEWEHNEINIIDSDEDVHTVNERRLIELVGNAGGKLHTGRSRNDQVVTDMKLWMKTAVNNLIEVLSETLLVITKSASKYIDVLMPGYTHLQQAQPIRFSHWILNYGFYIQTDILRFQDFYKRVDVLPLGSGAIAGNSLGVDRTYLAERLNFASVTPNSMMAVSDRDFVIEFNFIASLISIHLSRMAEDLILYTTKEFGFITLADAFSTGSSLMPQKRNPDSLELIRGISGEIFGFMSGFMMSVKGLPSTYNKDLQSDKVSMFTVYDKLKLALMVLNGVIDTFMVNETKCRSALSYDMLATDLAYYLVRKNIPFRDAHHTSGEVVALAERLSIPIHQLNLKQLQSVSVQFDDDVLQIWNFDKSVEQYDVIGGTAKNSVLHQIDVIQKFMNEIKK